MVGNRAGGTFGVSSAGYWLGRALDPQADTSCIGYVDAVWALLYGDDGKSTGRTERYEMGLLLHLFILVVLNVF